MVSDDTARRFAASRAWSAASFIIRAQGDQTELPGVMRVDGLDVDPSVAQGFGNSRQRPRRVGVDNDNPVP